MTYFIDDYEYTLYGAASHYSGAAETTMAEAQTFWEAGDAYSAAEAFKRAGQYRAAALNGRPGLSIHFEQFSLPSKILGIAIFTHCANELWGELHLEIATPPAPHRPTTREEKWNHIRHYAWMMEGLAKGEWPFAFSQSAYEGMRKQFHDEALLYMRARIAGASHCHP